MPVDNRPQVIYDARWLRVDHTFDGISRYSCELATALHARDDMDITWLIYDKRQLKLLPKGRFILANNPANIAKESILPRKLNTYHPDIVYSPFFVMGFRGRAYKLVVTIHDLIYFTHRTPPQWLPPYVRLAWRLFHLNKAPMRSLLNQADIVATVSDTARDELRARHMTKRPIISVKNAVAETFYDKRLFADFPHHSSHDVIYMGMFTPYKNVELLIQALAYVDDVRLHLLSPVPPKRRYELEDLIALRGVGDRVVFHDGVSDAKYRELLMVSRCLITASKLEGFGLPIIEAQAMGVPVACSDTPIFREVAQDSAEFFDPDSPEQCAAALRRLSQRDVSEQFVLKGFTNARRFSWAASAAAAHDICQRLMK